jgi:hypothetical protein
MILQKNGTDFPDSASQLLAQAAANGRLETTRFFPEQGGDANTTVRKFRNGDGPNSEYIMPLIVRAASGMAGLTSWPPY